MRKSQAAMEFLMTYGWAILVVITAIAALAYFGVFSVKKNMPQVVTGFNALTPIGQPSGDKTNGKIYISFVNNVGDTISIYNGTYNSKICGPPSGPVGSSNTAYVYFCDVGDITCTSTSKSNIEDGEQFTVVISCDALEDVDYERGELKINYYNSMSQLPYAEEGTIRVRMIKRD